MDMSLFRPGSRPDILLCFVCSRSGIDWSWLRSSWRYFRCPSCREGWLVERFSTFFQIANTGNRTSITSVATVMSSILWFVYEKPQLLQRRKTMRWFLYGGPSPLSFFWYMVPRWESIHRICMVQRPKYFRVSRGRNIVALIVEFLF